MAWLVAMCQFFFLKGNNDKLFDLSCQNKRKQQIFFIVGRKWGDEGYRVILICFFYLFYDFTIEIHISTINFSKIYVL